MGTTTVKRKRSPEQYLTIYPSHNRYRKCYELLDFRDFLELIFFASLEIFQQAALIRERDPYVASLTQDGAPVLNGSPCQAASRSDSSESGTSPQL